MGELEQLRQTLDDWKDRAANERDAQEYGRMQSYWAGKTNAYADVLDLITQAVERVKAPA